MKRKWRVSKDMSPLKGYSLPKDCKELLIDDRLSLPRILKLQSIFWSRNVCDLEMLSCFLISWHLFKTGFTKHLRLGGLDQNLKKKVFIIKYLYAQCQLFTIAVENHHIFFSHSLSLWKQLFKSPTIFPILCANCLLTVI